MILYRLCKPLCLGAALAFVYMTALPAQTTTVFEPITDVAELTDGTSFYIVSVDEVPYAVTADDPTTDMRLLSSYTNAGGLGVRCMAENRIQKLTIIGSDPSDCYLKQGDKRYLGYAYGSGVNTYVTDELTDEYRFSISIEADGSVTIRPYLKNKLRIGMYCGEEGAKDYTFYAFRFFDASDTGYVPVMLVSDISEQLADAPTISSTDGMLVSEPIIPEGYTLEYRVREVADPTQLRVGAAADDADWKPWNRQSYISDLFAITTEQYDLDMRYYSDGLYSAVTTERFQKPVLTGVGVATVADSTAGPTYYDITGRPISRRALLPGHPYIRVQSSRADLIIAR